MTEKKKQEKKSEKKIREEISIPADVEVQVDGETLQMKKQNVILIRVIHPLVKVSIEGNTLILTAKKNRKVERRLIGTFAAHIKNMVLGFHEPFKDRLQVVNVHFPMTVSHDKEKKEIVVK